MRKRNGADEGLVEPFNSLNLTGSVYQGDTVSKLPHIHSAGETDEIKIQSFLWNIAVFIVNDLSM